MKKIFQYGVLLALAALSCVAQQSKVYQQGDSWIEEVSGTLAQPAHNLKLITDMGSVHVEGGNQGNVSYTVRKRVRAGSEQEARRAFETIRVSAGGSAGRLPSARRRAASPPSSAFRCHVGWSW
ncbi:MAG: hypothetical protein DMG66_00795 [Acidobacteria bacterium]|nr:MAG: hypothetical protein DMG66_00795 [Acidobacteriota bacterium]